MTNEMDNCTCGCPDGCCTEETSVVKLQTPLPEYEIQILEERDDGNECGTCYVDAKVFKFDILHLDIALLETHVWIPFETVTIIFKDRITNRKFTLEHLDKRKHTLILVPRTIPDSDRVMVNESSDIVYEYVFSKSLL